MSASGVLRSPLHSAAHNITYELLHRFVMGDTPQSDIPSALSSIFNAQDYKWTIEQLREQDLRMWVDGLDQVIDLGGCSEELRKKSLCFLTETCTIRRVLPMSNYFHGKLYKTSNRPIAGGTGDIWRFEDGQKRIYAVKVYRVSNGEEYKIKKYFKEVAMWKRLVHPNILPAFGAAPDIAEFCVVSPWMPSGDLLSYLTRYPGADRPRIMIGVADGLSYLHSSGVIHGDLKGLNIVFESTGIPKITDFACSRYDTSTPPEMCSFSLRWAAPEILEAQNTLSRCPTKMSDVYAFAMVVIEIFTGKFPFPDDSDLGVQLNVLKGKRPPKPVDASRLCLSSSAWKIVQKCWDKKRDKRPDMQYVASNLCMSW